MYISCKRYTAFCIYKNKVSPRSGRVMTTLQFPFIIRTNEQNTNMFMNLSHHLWIFLLSTNLSTTTSFQEKPVMNFLYSICFTLPSLASYEILRNAQQSNHGWAPLPGPAPSTSPHEKKLRHRLLLKIFSVPLFSQIHCLNLLKASKFCSSICFPMTLLYKQQRNEQIEWRFEHQSIRCYYWISNSALPKTAQMFYDRRKGSESDISKNCQTVMEHSTAHIYQKENNKEILVIRLEDWNIIFAWQVVQFQFYRSLPH